MEKIDDIIWRDGDGLIVARKFERMAVMCGYHVALGGSVLVSGMSSKDLDIIIYPHDENETTRPSPNTLMELFRFQKLISTFQLGGSIAPQPPTNSKYRMVFTGVDRETGKRIDFLFV